jgi:thiamine biosynthesis lipoprotein
MATRFEVAFPLKTENSRAFAEEVLDLIDQLEDRLTVYRDHSVISRLNREASESATILTRVDFGLLELCARLHADTEGAFDVAIGKLIKAWGFYRPPRRIPSEDERWNALAQSGMYHVVLDAERLTVRFLRPGLELNLGAVGKGYALDQAAEKLRRVCDSAILHGGHSSVYAIGTQPGDGRGWPVGINHPWDQGRRLATVWLRDEGLGTSAATYQYLEWRGRKLGHILDPRTGWPAEGLASVTVIAPTAAEADALSTAFYILGLEKTRAYCERNPAVGAVVLPNHESTPVVLNLDPSRFALSSHL